MSTNGFTLFSLLKRSLLYMFLSISCLELSNQVDLISTQVDRMLRVKKSYKRIKFKYSSYNICMLQSEHYLKEKKNKVKSPTEIVKVQ